MYCSKIYMLLTNKQFIIIIIIIKINAQNRAVHLTLDKVKAETVREGGAVAED